MSTAAAQSPVPRQTQTLVLLCLAELLAMSLWFTGTAVLPQLAQAWGSGLGAASWLTLAVQLGFVAGALFSAAFNLPDHFRPTRVFVFSSLAAAGCNALFAIVAAQHEIAAIVLRFFTGALLAGVYPTGMKILAGWFQRGRGFALGALVGALTVGSAVPHAVNALGSLADCKLVVLSSSGLALMAAAIVWATVREGPFDVSSPPFDVHQIGQVFLNSRLALANLGYLGHMWELYSMWGWIALILARSAELGSGASRSALEAASFFAIAIGAVGCLWAGRVSDRSSDDPAARLRQRSRVTIIAMAVSAACCLLTAIFFQHFPLVLALAMLWGIAVIADSAQFSAVISEVADRRYVGTALTMQTALGFLLTAGSIRLTAYIGEHAGWRWAAASLAIGPLLGIWAMFTLMRVEGHMDFT